MEPPTRTTGSGDRRNSKAGRGRSATAVSPGLVTPAGSSVAIQPLSGVSLTFDSVTAGGNTTVTSGNTSQLTLPAHFEISGVPVFFDVTTSATFTGNVNVCFPYDPTGLTAAQIANLRLLHEDNGTLVDVTTSVDTVNHQICGAVSHFSQFVVAQHVNHPPVADAGPDRTVSVGPACTAAVTLDGFGVDRSRSRSADLRLVGTVRRGERTGTGRHAAARQVDDHPVGCRSVRSLIDGFDDNHGQRRDASDDSRA